MQFVFPDYYKNFTCIAGSCRHNCCIGWEIDIDEDTLRYYDSVSGPFGQRLQKNISRDDTPHFILGAEERCPFLNEKNLCDIILTLGEECICGICSDHPRFRNELPGRVETGLGLCCEEAARLILSQSAPVTLEYSGEQEYEDEIIALRDRVFTLLQDRTIPVTRRVEEMLRLCSANSPSLSIGEWASLLLELERLDPSWTDLLLSLKEGWKTADYAGFSRHMESRQSEYEQLLVYLIYRHMANAPDFISLAARASFAALIYHLLYTLGAVIWTNTGLFSFEDQVELARLFSSEIEYSDENLYLILDSLAAGE